MNDKYKEITDICIKILKLYHENNYNIINEIKTLYNSISNILIDEVIIEYILPPISIILSEKENNIKTNINCKEICMKCINLIIKSNNLYVWNNDRIVLNIHEWCGNGLSYHPNNISSCEEFYNSTYEVMSLLYTNPKLDNIIKNNVYFPLLSYVLFNGKENISNTSFSVSNRILGIKMMSQILNLLPFNFLQSIFPGIISLTSKIIIKEKYVYHELINSCIKLFDIMNINVLDNNNWPYIVAINNKNQLNLKDNIDKNTLPKERIDWYNKAVESLSSLLPKILESLINSTNYSVRLNTIELIDNILIKCSNTYYQFYPILFKYYLMLFNDNILEVKTTAENRIKEYFIKINSEEYNHLYIYIMRTIEELLKSSVIALPRVARTTINNELLLYFNTINGCLNIFKYNNYLNITVSLNSIILSFIECFEMNIKEMISNESIMEYNEIKQDKLNENINLFRFLYHKRFLYLSDNNVKDYISVVQNLLLCYDSHSIIESIINSQNYITDNLYPSLIYILNIILIKLNYNEIENDVNDLINFYNSDNELIKDKDVIELSISIHVEGLAILSNSLKSNFNSFIFTVLWRVLENIGSNIDIIHTYSLNSLNIISISCGYESISIFVQRNIDYIIDGICKRLHYIDYYPNTPNILSFLWKYKEYINDVQYDDLISCLFDSIIESDNIIPYLKSIRILTQYNDEININSNNFDGNVKELSEIYKLRVFSSIQSKENSYNIYTNSFISEDEFCDYIFDKYKNINEPKISSLCNNKSINTNTTEEYVENIDDKLESYEKTIKKVYINITPYILSNDINILYNSLCILLNCLKHLSKYKQVINPLIYSIWDNLIFILKKKNVNMYKELFNVINNIILLSPNFVYQRFYSDILPYYKSLLTKYKTEEIEGENKGLSYQPLIESILQSLYKIPLSIIFNNIYEISNIIIFLINSNIPDNIRILTLKCLLRFCNIDWYSVYNILLLHYHTNSIENTINETQTPFIKQFLQLIIQ